MRIVWGSHTFRQTVRRILCLSSTREVGLKHGRGSPYFRVNILHNLCRCTTPNVSIHWKGSATKQTDPSRSGTFDGRLARRRVRA